MSVLPSSPSKPAIFPTPGQLDLAVAGRWEHSHLTFTMLAIGAGVGS